MSRIEKIYRRLDELEAEFQAELTRELRECVETRSYRVFACSELLPEGYPPHGTELADALLAQVETIRELKEKVGESFSETLAARYLNACELWAGKDPHRGSAESIARNLLSQSQSPDESA